MLKSTIDEYQIEKLKGIKALFFDVDGVLTDGTLIYSGSGDELKAFNVKDGQIIRHLKECGIVVGAITGRSSNAVKRRCEELKLDFFEQGVSDKGQLIDDKLKSFDLTWSDLCYIGDDIIDLQALRKSGFSASPNDALDYVKSEVDYICTNNGGHGVVREVADLLLHAQGKLESIVKSYY